MIRNVVYTVAFLAIISCQSIDKSPKPESFIEEDRMVEILTDIAFVRAAKSSNRKTFEEKNINPEAFILKKHGIDSIIFAENNAWYSGQIEKYEAIFVRVKANLDKEAAKYEKLKKEEDSIKKIKIEDSIAKSKDTVKLMDLPAITEDVIEDKIEEAKKKRTNTPPLPLKKQ
ncbi:hypothetical protein ATO12_08750 [Aquimarina atlantica]|uniref:DUF4296 domain-containing protein n=1 Tax=Aquimarina atlantica TaxID=1317122 RepID=A0A023BYT4_9FLAO|nr:DUF4296 domain-containing protein [Aquimarina atlantica]EZH74818.1 hypothetical protein ATO12_08750 [Aquimarina atlantica]